MKKVLLLATVALATLATAEAAPPRGPGIEKSMDAPRRGFRRPHFPNMPEAALSPGSEDVGDGDSFGRSVKFLGYAQTYGVSIQADCTEWPAGTCATSDGTGSTTIEHFDDAAVVRLPARSANSLLCFSITPFGFAAHSNPSALAQNASASMQARWVIESEVLADPLLIDANTGLPFGGSIQNGSILYSELETLAPGASKVVSTGYTRTCNAGHLTRAQLIERGLTPAQAREVFRKPITIRFGSRLTVSWGAGGVSPGIRIFGD